MSFNVKEYLIESMGSILGAPVSEVIDREIGAYNTALNQAFLEYWIAMPHTIQKEYNFMPFVANTDGIEVDIEQLKETVYPNPKMRQGMYFIGLVRYDVVHQGLSVRNLDAYLLGVAVQDYYRPGERLDIERLLLDTTEADITEGELDILYDDVTGKVRFTLPTTFGQIHAHWGFGWDRENSFNKIGVRNLPIVEKLARLRFVTICIQARGQIEVQGDYTLNTSFLETLRSELMEEVTDELARASVPPIVWA